MTALLFVGGGGHCRSCIDVIEAEGRYQIVGVVQPISGVHESLLCYPVVGTDEDLAALLARTPKALVTVGQIKSAETRIRLFNKLKSHSAELPVIQAPTAYCSRHAVVGEGSILIEVQGLSQPSMEELYMLSICIRHIYHNFRKAFEELLKESY